MDDAVTINTDSPQETFMVISDAADMSFKIDQKEVTVDLAGVRGDDWLFGVNACAANGQCSPVASAVPGGAFAPLPVAEAAE